MTDMSFNTTDAILGGEGREEVVERAMVVVMMVAARSGVNFPSFLYSPQ
jgi:hypothetical protein